MLSLVWDKSIAYINWGLNLLPFATHMSSLCRAIDKGRTACRTAKYRRNCNCRSACRAYCICRCIHNLKLEIGVGRLRRTLGEEEQKKPLHEWSDARNWASIQYLKSYEVQAENLYESSVGSRLKSIDAPVGRGRIRKLTVVGWWVTVANCAGKYGSQFHIRKDSELFAASLMTLLFHRHRTSDYYVYLYGLCSLPIRIRSFRRLTHLKSELYWLRCNRRT
jgi:hypothetical protein